ncbi:MULTISPECIES: methyltransferase domain-containing protein [unclassified Mesorhizobium]|uniref:class I SAM-dependent methyltransferase n=1 Tax=unclassified Mesorhizobium TaxID=325217 RepID=UPI000FCB4213|nr:MULTISPECIES: methyltransferase domain-containing protein [unclassified Mesorhizobium]RUX94003.1 methyltransferase domain-containing protein [Mesorhizobium sp. M7D.F.Ca.US.004.01.2.1]RVA35811.1 methyltransferase domain-containing protein [Mesorhizobium sp. M7D.F.Ca.US.004.03.1.1]
MSIADIPPFFLAWLRNPRSIAAVAPSGARVAALMTQDIDSATGPVMELGPGTGAFTYSLLKRGVCEKDLTLVEFSADFVQLLKSRFPQARVLKMDATRLADLRLFDRASAGAVISGLGFRAMQPKQVTAILNGAFKYLRPNGAFYQITYGPRCPVPEPVLDHLNLSSAHVGRTVWNIPPASVYRISRSDDCA